MVYFAQKLKLLMIRYELRTKKMANLAGDPTAAAWLEISAYCCINQILRVRVI